MRILKPVYGKESRKEERISRLEVQYLMAQFPLYEKHNWLYGSIRRPVKWSKYRVKVIVFFALNSEDTAKTKVILEEAFSLIKTKEMIEKLSSMKNKKAVIKYIFGGSRFD